MKKLNDWKYEISYNDKNIPILEIIPDKVTSTPKTLSKYYALNKNNVHAFINRQFYVSQPENLNDLFDFHLNLIDFSKHKFSHIEILFQDGKEKREAFNAFKNNKTEYLEKLRNTLYGIWISSLGILCMTEDKYNDLMWGHYTNNIGFLLEFNHNNFNKHNFLGPYPINYLPIIEPIDFSTLDKNLGFFIVSLIKKSIWKYENEFRYFCMPNIKKKFKVSGRFSNSQFNFDLQERLISYPDKALNKIILAFNFYNGDITETLGKYEYILNFKGDNALLKSSIFNKIITDNLSVEICVQIIKDFKLDSVPIKIEHVNGTIYKIREIR